MTGPARLSPQTLAQLPASVGLPGYDRDAQAVGIVHFGIGAFHRAHQAWYTDAAMAAGDRDWAILGVSLRSPEVARQMNPQAGLYALAERDGTAARTRVIGAVRGVLVAGKDPEAVIAAVAAPATRIVTLTITEKGYCRDARGDLDLGLADEGSVYRFLAEGLARRRQAGLAGLTLLSCDNLAANGQVLEHLMGQYLARHHPDLAAWCFAQCTFPSTMVDRIVPATTDADRAALRADLAALTDEACVVTEPFSQWVIEDRFAGPRPRWDAVGAQIVADVAPYELAKLRMLNGAHSLLAYCGLARGHTFVHEAVADPELRALALKLMREEAAPTIVAAPGQDLEAYAEALIARFDNRALNHRLLQIAMDGSQKLPQRWLATLADNAAHGKTCPAILAGLGAWIGHLRGHNGTVADPLADGLAMAARSAEPVMQLFGPQCLLASSWQPTRDDVAQIVSAIPSMPHALT